MRNTCTINNHLHQHHHTDRQHAADLPASKSHYLGAWLVVPSGHQACFNVQPTQQPRLPSAAVVPEAPGEHGRACEELRCSGGIALRSSHSMLTPVGSLSTPSPVSIVLLNVEQHL